MKQDSLDLWPTISMVVPTFNSGERIGRALESLKAQNYPKLEVIVIDGASSDETLDIVRGFGDLISTILSEPDSGPNDAVNKGFERATSDLVGLLNSDDWIEGEALCEVGRRWAKGARFDVCSFRARIVELSDGIEKTLVDMKSDEVAFALENLLDGRIIPNARLVRCELLKEILPIRYMHDGKPVTSADLEYMLRLWALADETQVVSSGCYVYEAHAGSATMSGDADRAVTHLKETIRIIKQFRKDHWKQLICTMDGITCHDEILRWALKRKRLSLHKYRLLAWLGRIGLRWPQRKIERWTHNNQKV